MKISITSRDIKFFLIGVFAMFIFVLICDWDQFEKGLMGEPPHDTVKTNHIH